MTRLSLGLTVGATVLAGVAFAGCGGGDGSLTAPSATGPDTSTAVQRLRDAGDTTRRQSSFTVAETVTIHWGDIHATLTVDGVGDFGSGAYDVYEGGEYGGITYDTVHVLSDGTTVWASEDEQTWYEMGAAEMDDDDDSSAGVDADSYLSYLAAVGGEVREVGPEDLDGMATTHFAAPIDVEEYARLHGKPGDLERWKELGVTTMPVDVWVDGDNLVRRVTMTVDAQYKGAPYSREITYDLSAFGTAGEVTTSPTGTIVPGDRDTVKELLRP